MRVLLVNGSPNADGCTFTALSEVAGILQAQGVGTEFFQIGSQPLRGCKGCGTCRKNGFRCIYDDAANRLIEKAQECDGFVFGSPVYFASANGAFISLLDRAFYAGSRFFKYKPAACVVSARRAGTTAALDQLLKYPGFASMPVVSSQYWCMVHGNTPEQVRKDEEGMQVMRTLGRNMAWLLKCIELGRREGVVPEYPEAPARTNFIR